MKNIFLFILSVSAAFAGPVVTPTNNAATLANTLLGSGVTIVGTPTITETGPQSGTFTGGPSLLGFSSGIILSSGDAASASSNYAGANLPSTDEGGPGSAALSALIGGTATNDASTLTFSFIPTASKVFFTYVLASAEYPNYVNTAYNDVFGFFVNGVNYATVPGTTTPVSINNINAGTNSAYFNKYNAAGDPLPYGGETIALTFTAPVSSGVTNTISLGIADATDSILDSAVFIEAGTFSTTAPSPAPEPATVVLLGLSLTLFGGISIFRRMSATGQRN